MKRVLAVLTAVVLLSGCAGKSLLLKGEPDYSSVYFPKMQARSFNIVDERKDVSSRQLNPEFFARSGSADKVSPELSAQHKELIKKESLQYLGKNGEEYDITVFLEKAEKSVRSAWPTKYESVSIAVRIRLSNSVSVKTCANEATMEIKSLKAEEDYLEKMYQKTIKECIYGCFAELKKAQ